MQYLGLYFMYNYRIISVKGESKKMKTERNKCLGAFMACKSAQDNATFIMTKCRDPLPMLRKKLTALKKALDGTIKGQTALKLFNSSSTNSSNSTNSNSTGLFRHKREVIVTSITIITSSKFCVSHVCKITFNHLPQSLSGCNQSLGTLGP